MRNIFFISDHHFNHANILKFVSSYNEGKLVRPEFTSIGEMNEFIIKKHNETVMDDDKVYFLGDVGMGTKNLRSILSRLKGHKRLILGNHDGDEEYDFLLYFEFFEKVLESRRMGDILFTHRPVLLGANEKRIRANVHGHIHEQNIDDDKRYFNISVERIAYTPISLDDIIAEYAKKGIRNLDPKL